jgi:hypothetical protein
MFVLPCTAMLYCRDMYEGLISQLVPLTAFVVLIADVCTALHCRNVLQGDVRGPDQAAGALDGFCCTAC